MSRWITREIALTDVKGFFVSANGVVLPYQKMLIGTFDKEKAQKHIRKFDNSVTIISVVNYKRKFQMSVKHFIREAKEVL